MLDDGQLFTVTDLKQYAYCPRVVFYERCLPRIRPTTYKMEAGAEEHEDESKRSARRRLSRYAVSEGERIFDLRLSDHALGLSGLLDEVVLTASECIPVDFKLSKQVSANHRLQLAAYGLLLEGHFGRPALRGYIHLMLSGKSVEVKLTAALKDKVRATLAALHEMVRAEKMPPPTPVRNSCFSCEFRRFCNDV
jgi:CRISPR-associated exonuclease Cas4